MFKLDKYILLNRINKNTQTSLKYLKHNLDEINRSK